MKDYLGLPTMDSAAFEPDDEFEEYRRRAYSYSDLRQPTCYDVTKSRSPQTSPSETNGVHTVATLCDNGTGEVATVVRCNDPTPYSNIDAHQEAMEYTYETNKDTHQLLKDVLDLTTHCTRTRYSCTNPLGQIVTDLAHSPCSESASNARKSVTISTQTSSLTLTGPTSTSASSARRPSRPSDFPLTFRPRTCSVPCRILPNSSTKGPDEGGYYRMRSFSTSGNMVINKGDAFRYRSASQASLESNSSCRGDNLDDVSRSMSSSSAELQSRSNSVVSTSSSGETPTHRILVLGLSGVGKTALMQQFMTSEYLEEIDTCAEDEESEEHTVSIQLDEEEAILHLIEEQQNHEAFNNIDAYVIVYSVNDLESFHHACRLLADIRKSEDRQAPAILVANKGDLVRTRVISREEAMCVAFHMDCKYIEVSVLLDHQVDELLVGILSQIRLMAKKFGGAPYPPTFSQGICLPHQASCAMHKAARGLFNRLFGRSEDLYQSCDNLLVL